MTGLTRLWRTLGVGNEDLQLVLEIVGSEAGALVLQVSSPAWDNPVAPLVESRERPSAAMRPRRLEAESILGFSKIAVGFSDRLVVLLGPNGSGKTSFLAILEFLRQAAGDAGGSELGRLIAYLQPIRTATPRFGRIFLELEPEESDGSDESADRRTLCYEIQVDYQSGRLVGESLVERWSSGDDRTLVGKAQQHGHCSFLDETSGTFSDWSNPGSVLALQDPTLEREPTLMQVGEFLRGTRYFTLDPDHIAAPAITTVGAELTESGGELVAVLENIRNRAPERFAEVTERLREVAPYIRDIAFDPAGKSAREVIVVTRSGTRYPLSVESAGVRRTLALLGLRFGLTRPTCALVDEIENGLHPDALLRNVEWLRSMSEESPPADPAGAGAFVVLATHSPVVVEAFHDRPDAVLLTRRDPKSGELQVVGLSQAAMVVPREELEGLLQQFGLRDLWLAGALEPPDPDGNTTRERGSGS